MSRQIFSEIFSEIPRMSALIMITSRACHCITAHCDPCPRRGDDHDHGGNRGWSRACIRKSRLWGIRVSAL